MEAKQLAVRAATREALRVKWEAKKDLWSLRTTSSVAFLGSTAWFWWAFRYWTWRGGSFSRESIFYATCGWLGETIELLLPGLALAIVAKLGSGYCDEQVERMSEEMELKVRELELTLMRFGAAGESRPPQG